MTALSMTTARRVILAAGVPVALAIIAISVSGWVRLAMASLADQSEVGYPVALSIPVSDDRVRVTLDNGDISVRTGTGRRIGVHGILKGAITRPAFRHRSTPAGLVLNPQCRAPIGGCSLSFTVTAPAGLPVTVGSSFGNLSARGLHGTVALSENSGDLDAASLTGDIRLTDSFGEITASGLAGNVSLDDNSGDIAAAGLTGDIRLTDSFGDISVTGVAADDVVCNNNSGDITLRFSKVPRRVNVTDSFANVVLELPPGHTAYAVDTHTTFGNTVVSVPRAPAAPDVITVTNSSGDITIVNQ